MPSSTSIVPQPSRSLAVRQRAGDSLGLTWFQRIAKQRILQWLDQFTGGAIRFSDSRQTASFGVQSTDSLRADWNVEDSRFYNLVATNGSLGLAESYLRGHWQTDDLTRLMRLLCRNMHRVPEAQSAVARCFRVAARGAQFFERNTPEQSRRNIAAHYDLSNEFFETFLDPTLMYSAGWFEHEDSTLHEASVAKLDQICRKLDLQDSDSVLEIGTGWGGFALHAATKSGCDLTTTTISAQQYLKAEERFRDAGISDRVRLMDTDYRELSGQYDKLVSIEMIEAVGEGFLETYFRHCNRLLRPGGRFVIQAIVMPEQRYASYRRGVDFIQKYIFPGGFLPSVTAIQASVGRTSNLRLEHVEDLSPHYARTLQEWRRRFFDRIDDVRRLGFDDRFIRMWEYYLCYCEAAFREQAVRVVQIVWDKPSH